MRMEEFLKFLSDWALRNGGVPFLLFVALCSPLFAQESPAFDGKSWWEHVNVIASDEMEGRDTGSPGLRKAQAYIVEELKKSGIQPAGSEGFYQPIEFISRQLDESRSSMALVRNGKVEPLVFGEDDNLNKPVDPLPHVDAPLIFAGYGLRIPEMNYDDFAGIDAKGKVLVVFSGSPSEVPGPLASHYQSMAERAKVLKAVGAIGYLTVPNPAAMDIPWERIKASRHNSSMGFAEEALNDSAAIRLSIYFNPASAQKVFEGTGHKFEEIAALGKERKPLPHFPLNANIRVTQAVAMKPVESANVIGKLEGSAPTLKNEYVVLSAHTDHLGIGTPINGDRIYNGAMDNGSGTAVLLDMAAALSKLKPKRSVLFVFVTGEEKGLLGSRYFTAHPTVPLRSMVGNINIDMFQPIIPLKLLTIYGLAESDLGDLAAAAAKKEGVEPQADPEPLRNLFIRSDQYNFIKNGIPALAMKVGAKPGTPEAETQQKWLHERYHAPSDDLNQPVDLEAAGKFEDIVRDLTIEIANDSKRPEWKANSFFRRYAQEQTAGK
jgi:Zn-dependent M28 family amino/carboxypeptidase